MADREKIIRRVVHLSERTVENGSSPEEEASATRLAKHLIERYSLKLDEVQRAADQVGFERLPRREQERVAAAKAEEARRSVVGGLARDPFAPPVSTRKVEFGSGRDGFWVEFR